MKFDIRTNMLSSARIIIFEAICCVALATSYAGPMPYGSIRIFVGNEAHAVKSQDAAKLREGARIVLSLTDVEAADFWRALEWPDKMKVDESVAASQERIYMIVDCYGRREPPFTGHPDTLLCTTEKAYNPESGRFIPTSYLVEALLQHLMKIIPKRLDQGGAGNPAKPDV